VLEDDVCEDDCSETLPSVEECGCNQCLKDHKSYILAQANDNADIFYRICGLENFCSSYKSNSMKQEKITDFLK
jgi:hypothetical protein